MLTNRQNEILKLIVLEYIKLAKPVGSNLICDRLKCSSATVRSEMAALEELGLLEKTHTSSGRIPSVKGYKLYVSGVLNNKEELDSIANKYLNNWNILRLGIADAAILKIAIYELLYTDTPDKVCIDEAVELSKDFSDEKVSGMINGVLDKIYHERLENNER